MAKITNIKIKIPKPMPVLLFNNNNNNNNNNRNINNNNRNINRNLTKQRLFMIVLKDTIYEFAEYTKISGLYYLRRNITKGWTKVLWIITPIVALIFCAILVISLWSHFMDNPTIMTFDTPRSIASIPFPAVTICHTQTVIDYKIKRFVEYAKIPANKTKDEVLRAMRSIKLFNEREYKYSDFSVLPIIDDVLKLNHLTIKDCINLFSVDCSEILLQCTWYSKSFPCFNESLAPKFWNKTTSFSGMCCSFNYLLNHQLFQPLVTNSFGTGKGLTIIGRENIEYNDGKSGAYESRGYILYIHHPYDLPAKSSERSLINIGNENYVAIYPTITKCSNEVLALSPAARKCISPSDTDTAVNDNGYYSQELCKLKCLRNLNYKLCKCHPHFIPQMFFDEKQLTTRDCIAADIECFQTNIDEFGRIKCTDCMPPCFELNYKISSFMTYSNFTKFSIYPQFSTMNFNQSMFVAYIYFGNQMVTVQKKVLVTTWITLLCMMTNIGGVFNLCLGFSVLSIIEIFFYFAIKLPIKIWKEQQQEKNRIKLHKDRLNYHQNSK